MHRFYYPGYHQKKQSIEACFGAEEELNVTQVHKRLRKEFPVNIFELRDEAVRFKTLSHHQALQDGDVYVHREVRTKGNYPDSPLGFQEKPEARVTTTYFFHRRDESIIYAVNDNESNGGKVEHYESSEDPNSVNSEHCRLNQNFVDYVVEEITG